MSFAALDKLVIYDLGLVKPFHRFAAGWLLGSAIIWTVQPVGMFENQVPRSWTVLATNSEVVPPTKVPWFLPGVAAGLALAMFI